MTETETDIANPDLRKRLRTELRVSRRMLKQGIEVAPRFVIQGASGDEMVILTNLPTTGHKRQQVLRFLNAFMTFHMCGAFVMAFQTVNPNTLTAILTSHVGCAASTQSVRFSPLSFGDIVFHDPRHTDIDILDMLPDKRGQLSQQAIDSVRTFMSQNEIATNTFVLEV